jgi:hypothetical protein
MTILEVMFAIMITTIGLLGAIAVFPVASEYARKGRLNDEVTVCAESAVHTMDARGMRRPERWITYRQDNMGNWLQVDYYTPAPNNLIQPGLSYCLDPRFIAANISGAAPLPSDSRTINFPAFAFNPSGQVSNNNPDHSSNGLGGPRMRRITLAYGTPSTVSPYLPFPYPMGPFQADYVFSFEDQLAYERPGVQKGSLARNDNAQPAFQLYSPIRLNNGTILPGKREEDGKLSWMATLVPKIDRWNATLEDKYVLSIVVFYSRSPSLRLENPSVNPPTLPFNEWTAIIFGDSGFHSTGYGGGEVTISATSPDRLRMRAGDWLMLSGHVMARDPVNNVATTVPTFKWYKVTDADEDPRGPTTINGTPYYQRDVTLVGPDWDMQDVLPISGPGNNVPDDVEVTIIPNIVAVFDRTIRLERDGTGF